ncbi:MAG: DUF2911 domain-containing protein [Ignavibacteriaceae bacterium]|nr:DUF2911 domain-containing protein [Ignavibacteriaceae bacterium]
MRYLLTALIAMFLASESMAQVYAIPRPSPISTVTQVVGISEVTVKYARPAKNNRKVFGELVPFGKLWRTGANENSTVTLSDEATIGGVKVPAGTYSFFTIPGEKEWTVILNKDNNLSGTTGYKQENDIVRVNVTPVKTGMTERLTIDFDVVTDEYAHLSLMWEETKISLKIEFDTHNNVMKKLQKDVSWSPSYRGAEYLLNKNTDLEKALNYINVSVAINENYWNLRIKARIHAAMNDIKGAKEVLQKALDLGAKMESKPFDYEDMKKLYESWD